MKMNLSNRCQGPVSSGNLPVVVLSGLRQTGKSTLLQNEQGRHEVDFVIEVRRGVVAVEVKAATRWGLGDLSGLRAFVDRTPACVAAVLAYNGREAVQLDGKLWAIPLGHLLA